MNISRMKIDYKKFGTWHITKFYKQVVQMVDTDRKLQYKILDCCVVPITWSPIFTRTTTNRIYYHINIAIIGSTGLHIST